MRSNKAFTLVELLVVVVIIGLLAGLAIPAISTALKKAEDSACKSNLRQLGIAFMNYASENNGQLPATVGADGQWNVAEIRRYMFDPNATGATSSADFDNLEEIFLCPACIPQPPATNPGPALKQMSGYGKNSHLGADIFGQAHDTPTPLARLEYTSHAAMLLDFAVPNYNRYQMNTAWKRENTFGRHGSGSKRHINICFADGHVESMTEVEYDTIIDANDERTWKFLTGKGEP